MSGLNTRLAIASLMTVAAAMVPTAAHADTGSGDVWAPKGKSCTVTQVNADDVSYIIGTGSVILWACNYMDGYTRQAVSWINNNSSKTIYLNDFSAELSHGYWVQSTVGNPQSSDHLGYHDCYHAMDNTTTQADIPPGYSRTCATPVITISAADPGVQAAGAYAANVNGWPGASLQFIGVTRSNKH